MNMRSRIAALLAVACLCLAGCGATQGSSDSTGDTTPTTAAETTENSAETDTTAAPTEDTTQAQSLTTDATERRHLVCNGFARSLTAPSASKAVATADGTVYIADKNGVRRVMQDGTKKQLTKTAAKFLATDGSTILFTAHISEQTSGNSTLNGEIRSIGTDGSDETTLVRCTDGAQPLMLRDGRLYYTDTSVEEYAHQGLYIADPQAEEGELAAEGCIEPYAFGDTLVYNCRETEFNTYGTLKTFDCASGEVATVSDRQIEYNLECDGDKVYFTALSDEGEPLLCSYAPAEDAYDEAGFSANAAVCFSDEDIFFLSEETPYRVSRKGGEPEAVTPEGIIRFDHSENGVVGTTRNEYYYLHEGAFEPVPSFVSSDQAIFHGYCGTLLLFSAAGDLETVKVTVLPY